MSESRQYVILGVLGRGGFGTVYLADLNASAGYTKKVALKVMKADLSIQDEVARRTRDEARMLALLRHRAMVHVEGLVHLPIGWAVVLEYIEGFDLQKLLEQVGRVPPRPAAQIVSEVAGALHVGFHTSGANGQPLALLHRDIKPSNIRITPFGEVKLLDFGTARARFTAREAETRSIAFGTQGYLAPERLEFQDGPEADIFALGIVLYEMLTGARFGQTSGNPTRHEEKLRSAEADARAVTRGTGDALVALMAEMLRFDQRERPLPRDVERRAERIAAQLPADPLRDWAELTLPALLAVNPLPTDDPMVGQAMEEVPGPGLSLAPTLAPSDPPPLADRRTPAGVPPSVAPPSRPPARETPARVTPARVTPARATPRPSSPDGSSPRPAPPSRGLWMGALLTFGVLAFGGAAGMWVLLPRLFPQLPPLVTCPEAIPAEGTTCPADETCSYPTDTSCGLRPVVATCKDAAWTVAMAPCPTPTCPDAAPEAGAACESADLRCEYTVEKTCGKLPLHALCGTAGTWELQAEACPRNTTTTTASTVACPSSAPADASACASEKQRCTYRVSTDCGFQAMTASCQNGRWSAKPPTCESKPANAPGVVSIAGDVLVELVSTSGAHVAPGRVPAGHYTVWADFGNGPTDAYVSLDVRAGESVTVKCSKMMGRCSKQ